MMTHGWKLEPKSGMPKNVPEPRISRTPPSATRPIAKPTLMPTAFRTEGSTGFFEACASARARMMQFTTINWMNAPSAS